MGFNIAKNLAQSSLASGYTAGNTTITIQTGDGALFDAAPFVVAIGNPPAFFLKVTAVASDTFTVDTSGYDGSTAVSVTSATPVTEVIAAGVLESLLDSINLDAPLGAPSSLPSSGNGQFYMDNLPINQIPVMTSATTPSGTASASTSFSGVPAWWAFAPSENGWITDGTALPQWLQYQFPSAHTITFYTLSPWSADNFPSRSPTAWTLEGSNDGSTFTTLDTRSFSAWVINTPQLFTIASPGSYTYYRLNISANGGNTFTGVHSLGLNDPTGSSGLSLFLRDPSGKVYQMEFAGL